MMSKIPNAFVSCRNLSCLSYFLVLFIYFLQETSVFHSFVLLGDIFMVFYYLSVSKVCPQPLQVCQENFVPMMSYTHKHTHTHSLMCACMFSHSSKAAIITAYFRIE